MIIATAPWISSAAHGLARDHADGNPAVVGPDDRGHRACDAAAVHDAACCNVRQTSVAQQKAPRMIAASAVTFARVVTSLTAAPTRAPSTFANVRAMMAAIAIVCTVAACAEAPSRLSRNSAKTTASEATAVGVVINTYNQPNTNA